MIIPKNCGSCLYYKHQQCAQFKEPVGNINTCDFWTPLLNLVMNRKEIVFVDFNQYKLERRTDDSDRI